MDEATTSEDLSDQFDERLRSQSFDELRSTFPNLTEKDLAVLMKLKQENINEKSGYSCSSQDEKQSYPPWIDIPTSVDAIISEMPEIDRTIILELQRANEESAFLAPTQTDIKSIPTTATEFLNVADGFVRRTIKLAKNIEFFKMISKEDQIALLKGSMVEIMMLRSAINYNVKSESWSLSTKNCLTTPTATATAPSPLSSSQSNRMTGQDSELSVIRATDSAVKEEMSSKSTAFAGGANVEKSTSGFDIGKLRSQFEQKSKEDGSEASSAAKIGAEILKSGSSETRAMFMSYAIFIKSLMKTIRGDVMVLKILIVLSLFSSDRQGLEEKHKVEEIQECYAHILQVYIASRYSQDKNLFAKVLMKLTDLRDINELHTRMLLQMKVDSIEPLLIEIFDLPI